MTFQHDIGIERIVSPNDLSDLREWLKEYDLNSIRFQKTLASWFANFASADDKRLALRLLTKLKYYSPTLYQARLTQLGSELKQKMLNNNDQLDRVGYIVAATHLDSSGLLAYIASKESNWDLSEKQILTPSDLTKGPIQANSLVVLNDTQGSGNQFREKMWPALRQHAESGKRVYVVCLELGPKAFEYFRQLSANIVMVPDAPTTNCLDYLMENNFITDTEKKRVEYLGKRANPKMPLGYDGCGLLVAYHYQCPNNTLPIFWGNGHGQRAAPWTPLFEYKAKRSQKCDVHPIPVERSPVADVQRAMSPVRQPQPFDIRKLISENEWITGAVNFDEDLHFSSFYLRASCKKFMSPESSDFGYSTLIAVYKDFNETYYIRRDECESVANALLQKITADPQWLQTVLDEIGRRAVELSNVFPYNPDADPFKDSSPQQLLHIYKNHNDAHRRLYEVARIPEALDRGLGVFEDFLRSELRRRLGHQGSDHKRVNAYLNVLTFPESASQAYEELTEFRELVLEVRRRGQQTAFTGSSKRTILKLDQQLRTRINRHRDKWSFWGYHGYGARALPDMEYYLRRIASDLSNKDVDNPNDYAKTLEVAEEQRKQLIRRLGIEPGLELMYRLHSRVGLAKLLRRYYQLRNFYFLDQLLYEAARRIGIPEAHVRCLLPEELEQILEGHNPLTGAELGERVENAVYIIHENEERLIAGEVKRTLVDGLLARALNARASTEVILRGTPVSPGVARGRCKKIIRKEDAGVVEFRPGDVLVSESTDMDLFELIRQASGVITEAGGATCHAAIVCRELKIPAIVGVRDALARLKNDQLVVLDADEGTITPTTSLDRIYTIEDIGAYEHSAEIVGNKARTISRLLRAQVTVPRFFCIPWSKLRDSMETLSADASGPLRRAISDEVASALEYLAGDMFVIRSSMASEDSQDGSEAGMWPSEAGVLRVDMVPTLLRYIERFRAEDRSLLRGCILVQEMILGDASGICFTNDPMDPSSRRLVIEMIPGGNELLTDGQISPIRYFASRATRITVLDDESQKWGSLLAPDELRRLVDLCLEVEAVIGCPQDIEWTVKLGSFFMLQSRPIVAGASGAAYQQRVAQGIEGRGVESVHAIYRAYRVPPNLQLHLLRVSALGLLICRNWKGPALNEETIVSALLLHDIGNIVKADYDRHPELFPEEMKNLGYWKAVQQRVRLKYGRDDLEASVAIARELGISDSAIKLIKRKQFVRNAETAASECWEVKVAAYADQRIGPHGVMALEERLNEAKRRYRGVTYASVNRPDFDALVRCAYEIEADIDRFVDIALPEISDDMLAPIMSEFRGYSLALGGNN